MAGYIKEDWQELARRAVVIERFALFYVHVMAM